MKPTWWQAIATPVLWLGVAVLLWALGAWLLFAVMDGGEGETLLGAVVPATLVVALVAGIVLSRRSPAGYLVLALAGAACAVLAWSPFIGAGGSFMRIVVLFIATATAVAALVRWTASRTTAGAPPAEAGPPATPAPRTPIEIGAASALAIAGLLVLARALLELVEGLAELPGASEHWAGDVILWLLFVLPIPVLAGGTLLAAGWWLWRHRIGARRATVAYVVSVGIAVAWIMIEAGWFLGQGNYWGSLDDPLIWTPVAILVGAVAGLLVVAILLVRRRIQSPT